MGRCYGLPIFGSNQLIVEERVVVKSEFRALAGTFAGTDEIHASIWSPGGTARADIRGEWEVGGAVLVQRWQDTRPEDVFELINVFMEDPATGEVLLYAYDSLGYPPDPPARGSWDGDHLVLWRSTERGESRVEFSPTPDGFRWSKRYRRSRTDAWQPVIDGEMRRTRAEVP
jgi:hypothetical protein